MIRALWVASLIFLFGNSAQATADDYRLEDYIYVDYIKTVTLNATVSKLSVPIAILGDRNTLELGFDDLNENTNQNFRYTLIHCNSDWTQSNLGDLEYMEGYTDDRVIDIQSAFNTIVFYNHYRIVFPNDNINVSKSGNYVIRVFEAGGKTLLTKRFVVTESLVSVIGQCTYGTNPGQAETHQEVDFTVNHKKLNIRNPFTEIKASVLQNWRWDNAVQNVPPFNVSNESMNFDYQGKIGFPAGKEFRWFDFQNISNPGFQIKYIKRYPEGFDVTLYKERPRANSPYFQDLDINGKFLIRQQNPFVEQVENDIRAEYANVMFSLDAKEPYDKGSVYLLGGFSQWQILPEYKMSYNNKTEAYEADVYLKQGLYNYTYALVDRGTADCAAIEGDWFETENEYTVLLYYRPFGERYDRVIGYGVINSRRRN